MQVVNYKVYVVTADGLTADGRGQVRRATVDMFEEVCPPP
jgi:hypothetical protein